MNQDRITLTIPRPAVRAALAAIDRECARLALAKRPNEWLRRSREFLVDSLGGNSVDVVMAPSTTNAARLVPWIVEYCAADTANAWVRAWVGPGRVEKPAEITPEDIANARASNAELDAAEANERAARAWANERFIRLPSPQHGWIFRRLVDDWQTDAGKAVWKDWDRRTTRLIGAMDLAAAELAAAREVWPEPTAATAAEPEFEQATLF